MRDNKIDNCKGILILLVVLGHILEFHKTGILGEKTYILIYSFHIPAFFFFMGMVAKPGMKRALKSLLIYVVFQTAYLTAIMLIAESGAELQYFIPYWLLWFSLVEAYYETVLTIVDRFRINWKYLFAISLVASLSVGYVGWIGYGLSLSRAFTFFPYYIAGRIFKDSKVRYEKHPVALVLAALCIVFLLFQNILTENMLYGLYSYELEGYNPLIKSLIYIIAFVLVLAMYMYMTDKKLPILNSIGKHTLPIYLIHGFIIRLLEHYNYFVFNPFINYLLSILTAFAMTFALSKVHFSLDKNLLHKIRTTKR